MPPATKQRGRQRPGAISASALNIVTTSPSNGFEDVDVEVVSRVVISLLLSLLLFPWLVIPAVDSPLGVAVSSSEEEEIYTTEEAAASGISGFARQDCCTGVMGPLPRRPLGSMTRSSPEGGAERRRLSTGRVVVVVVVVDGDGGVEA